MISPLDIAQRSALSQQSSAIDGLAGAAGPAGSSGLARASSLPSHQVQDWFAQSLEISVSASRSHETVEAHADRVLSHLLVDERA